uniref:Uncharacterized protein n=1 Tax=Ditylum brightwellii TaxID=49249 RepID=A0A6S8ZMQ3_9STRA
MKMGKWQKRISSKIRNSIGKKREKDGDELSPIEMEKTTDAVGELTHSSFLLENKSHASTSSESDAENCEGTISNDSQSVSSLVMKSVGGDATYSTFLISVKNASPDIDNWSTRLARTLTVALTEDVPIYCLSANTSDGDNSTYWAASLIVDDAADGDDATCSLTMKLKVSPEESHSFVLSLKLRNATRQATQVFQDVIVAVKAALIQTGDFAISGGRSFYDVYNLKEEVRHLT